MINNLLKILMLSGVVVCLFFNKSFSLTIIELKQSVCLAGEEIFLKDIAKLSDDSLSNVYIGKMPLAGRKRYISQDYVRLRLLQAKVKNEDFKLTGADKVEIIASSQKLDVKEITKSIEKYLLDKIDDNNQRVEIEPLQISQNIVLPAGKIEYELLPLNNLDLRRQVYIPVNINVDGKKARTVRLGFKIRRFGDVVVAERSLSRHRILTPLDLKIEEREITYVNPAPLDEVIGKRLNRGVMKGEILTYDLLEIPPLIKQGDVVTIKKEFGALTVTTKGIAKKDGRLGEEIQVKNIDSKRIIMGIVKDGKTVVVK